jgi:Uma2 family endonuclease
MSEAVAPLTLEAFLEWERRQPLRYEFDGIGAVAMTGGTAAHATIGINAVLALMRRLDGSGCRVFNGDLKVMADGRVRYPDASVTCTPVPRGSDFVPDPVVVFEVLSPSTAAVDRIVKNEEYRATESIQHYVMLEPDRMAATVFSRKDEDWIGRLLAGDAALDLPALRISIPLAEFYTNADLEPDTDD